MKGRTISQLAKECGVGVETIRFYERRGFLKQPVKPVKGYRHYDDDALAVIRYIKIGQQMGFRLSEMKRLQERAAGNQKAFCESVRAATREKIMAVEEEIARLQDTLGELKDFLGRCSAKKDHERCPVYEGLGSTVRRKI